MSQLVIIGLGTNVGNREAHLRKAIELLRPRLTELKESQVYASPAMLPEGAPTQWDMPFLNMAICGETTLTMYELLEHIRKAEEEIGRVRTAHWSPREIDIDILAYGQQVVDDDELHVPHPGMLERDFVLLPILDIALDWVYPRPSPHKGRMIGDIAQELLDGSGQCSVYKAILA